MGVNSFDVAEAAGVSQPTVSRALRDDPIVSAETRARVKEAARRLGYVTSERGRSLSTRSTQRVAMVVDLDNPLWALLVRQLHDDLAAAGYRLTLAAGHGDAVALENHVLGGGVDGVVLSTLPLQSRLPEELDRRGVPVVLLNRVTEGFEPDASIADDRAGGAAAARVLLEAGHRRLGALFGPVDTSTGRERERGFRETLHQAGVELPDRWVRYGPFDFVHGRKSVPEVLEAADRPTALFCANDIIAIGAMDTAQAMGVKVPDDLALVGFDDLEMASWPTFGLTTIAIPFPAMVHSAVGLLLDRMGGHSGAARRVVHPVTPVLRRTHRPGDAAVVR